MTTLAIALALPWFGAVLLSPFDGRRRHISLLAVACLAGTVAALGWLAAEVLQGEPVVMVAGNWPAGVGIVLRADGLGVTYALLSASVLLAATLFETLSGVRSRSFPALVLFLATGLTGLFLTGDAFNFYVFFEIAMISSYILTSYGEERRQLRAAVNFAVINLLGSVLFLIAIAGLYHITGRLDMAGIAGRMAEVATPPAILVGALIFVAFSIKLGLFPFHFWLAAVYTGTRPAVAAILSGALANIGSYGLLRFGGELMPRELEAAAPALLVLGTCSVLYGALQAMSRRSIADVLAYSSIGQAGYLLIAIGIGGEHGFAAAVTFAIVNALNKTLLFLSENVRGRMTGAIFAIGALSVAGIPPATGFLGKASLIRAALIDDNVLLVVLIAVGGLLSLIYMIQIFQRSFWSPEDRLTGASTPLRLRAVTGGLAMVIIILGVWPEPLLRISAHAAASLLGGSS